MLFLHLQLWYLHADVTNGEVAAGWRADRKTWPAAAVALGSHEELAWNPLLGHAAVGHPARPDGVAAADAGFVCQ
jgi:hypothetical protein